MYIFLGFKVFAKTQKIVVVLEMSTSQNSKTTFKQILANISFLVDLKITFHLDILYENNLISTLNEIHILFFVTYNHYQLTLCTGCLITLWHTLYRWNDTPNWFFHQIIMLVSTYVKKIFPWINPAIYVNNIYFFRFKSTFCHGDICSSLWNRRRR